MYSKNPYYNSPNIQRRLILNSIATLVLLSPEPILWCMHSLGHLMTSEGEKQFVLIVFLLGQFVITAISATSFCVILALSR